MTIKRDIQKEIEEHLKYPEITLILGPRQAGKTYIMRQVEDKLKKAGKKTLFLNLDTETDKKYFDSQLSLISKIKTELGEMGTVFLDEIQRKENAGVFLKGIYDQNLPYKFIVSGSGSLELKENIIESLMGRKRVFSVLPLSFKEFINYKTDYKFAGRLENYFQTDQEKSLELFKEYLTFGGYPRVVLANIVGEKIREMDEIYQSIIDRDIRGLLDISKSEAVNNLLKALAAQIGGTVNYTELSSITGIAHQTVLKYLYYLEKIFVLKKISPYFGNVRKEFSRQPKYYFYDLGLRNNILKLMSDTVIDVSGGQIFENFVAGELQSNINYNPVDLHYWRTHEGAEVDFLLEKGLELIPYEAKFIKMQKPEITKSFASFIDKYHPKIGYFIHTGEQMEKLFGKTKVVFLPYWSNL